MLAKHLCVWSRISHRVYVGLQNDLHPLALLFIGNPTACLVFTLHRAFGHASRKFQRRCNALFLLKKMMCRLQN